MTFGPGHPEFEKKFRQGHEPARDSFTSEFIDTRPERPPTLNHYLNRFPPEHAHIAKQIYAEDRAKEAARTLQSYKDDPSVPPGHAQEHLELRRAAYGLPPPPKTPEPPKQQRQPEMGD